MDELLEEWAICSCEALFEEETDEDEDYFFDGETNGYDMIPIGEK